MDLESGKSMRNLDGPSVSFHPTTWPIPRESWPGWQTINPQPKKKPENEIPGLTIHDKASIAVKDTYLLRLYYEKSFYFLRQDNCRIIAKAYIKLVEPRKQVNYPYNGRKVIAGRTIQFDPEDTKPPWWPSGVSHREPDHLPKVGKRKIWHVQDLTQAYEEQSAFDF